MSVTIGVPNVDETARYYQEFGLDQVAPGRFTTVDGGEQLVLEPATSRRLLRIGVGADTEDDLGRIASQLRALGLSATVTGGELHTVDPISGVDVAVVVAPRLVVPAAPAPAYNGPGRNGRVDARAEGVLRTGPVRPRKLGHVVIGSPDKEASQRFFTEGLGFKVSDNIVGVAAFMRCSTDHHNVLVQQAPMSFLHHTAWEVDDVDEVGRGASAMLAGDPQRHTWGLGRHHIGSNFFWYLKDPAGNFSEYYSDLDCVIDDAIWGADDFDGPKGLYSWGPPPPPSFLMPDDIAAAMAGAHSAR
jgi:catechol 2,3-dioxygenase-like lactoylglutathione lyase family enzyme